MTGASTTATQRKFECSLDTVGAIIAPGCGTLHAIRVHPVDGGDARRRIGPMTATVLIVDDHAMFRAMTRRMLGAQGYEVVGEADTAAAAVEAVNRLRPDIVLLDVQLPDRDGFAVAEQLASGEVTPTVVLISSRDASSYRQRLSDSPARGFLPKSELTAAALSALVA
jgi:CheY-like chemotaxis protein